MYPTKVDPATYEIAKTKCFLCYNKKRFEDWTGYQLCFKHYYESLRWGSGENCKWFYIKTTKIIL